MNNKSKIVFCTQQLPLIIFDKLDKILEFIVERNSRTVRKNWHGGEKRHVLEEKEHREEEE